MQPSAGLSPKYVALDINPMQWRFCLLPKSHSLYTLSASLAAYAEIKRGGGMIQVTLSPAQYKVLFDMDGFVHCINRQIL